MVDFTGLARLPLFLAAETWPIGITKAMENNLLNGIWIGLRKKHEHWIHWIGEHPTSCYAQAAKFWDHHQKTRILCEHVPIILDPQKRAGCPHGARDLDCSGQRATDFQAPWRRRLR